jgi:rhamnogalacturonan acetylesterase
MKSKIVSIIFSLIVSGLIAIAFTSISKPTLYLAGDSTVAHGWGDFISVYFDSTRINIENRAVAGTSSRTFFTKTVHDTKMAANGMWDGIIKDLKPGDYVMIEFGHNDDAPLADTARSRGSIKGTGNDSAIVFNPFTRQQEVVHTYGWYLKRLVNDVKARGATAIICSPIPKDQWQNKKIVRLDSSYNKWCAEAAAYSGAYFINLNHLIANRYDREDTVQVSRNYFNPDRIHTTNTGSKFNALILVNAIRNTPDLPLKFFLKQEKL